MEGPTGGESKGALGDFYRRMRAKLGAPKAITAAAHKLARIIFHLVTTAQEFDDSRFAADQLRYQKRQEAKLRAKAKVLGFQLIPVSSLEESEGIAVGSEAYGVLPCNRLSALQLTYRMIAICDYFRNLSARDCSGATSLCAPNALDSL